MESQIKKITLSFNLNDCKDKQLWNQLDEITVQTQTSNNKRSTSRGEILKQFIKPISGKELLELQKKMLSYQERMEIWRTMYGKINQESISLEKFIVEVMPKLKEKDLDEFENNYFKSNFSTGGNDVKVN